MDPIPNGSGFGLCIHRNSASLLVCRDPPRGFSTAGQQARIWAAWDDISRLDPWSGSLCFVVGLLFSEPTNLMTRAEGSYAYVRQGSEDIVRYLHRETVLGGNNLKKTKK